MELFGRNDVTIKFSPQTENRINGLGVDAKQKHIDLVKDYVDGQNKGDSPAGITKAIIMYVFSLSKITSVLNNNNLG